MARDTLTARLEREREMHQHEMVALQGSLDSAEAALEIERLKNAKLSAIMAVLKSALDQADA